MCASCRVTTSSRTHVHDTCYRLERCEEILTVVFAGHALNVHVVVCVELRSHSFAPLYHSRMELRGIFLRTVRSNKNGCRREAVNKSWPCVSSSHIDVATVATTTTLADTSTTTTMTTMITNNY